MSEINLFGRWKVQKKYVWWGGGIAGGLVVVLFLLAILGSAFGARSYAYEPGFSGGGFAYNESMDYGGDYYYYGDDAADYDFAFAEEAEAPAAYGVDGSAQTVSNTSIPAAQERLIIKSGNVSIEAEDTIAARDSIEDLVNDMAEAGAYVVTSSQSEGGYGSNSSPYVNMTIRVPAEEFDFMMDQIEKMGVKVNYSNSDAQDVTEEYVDLENRIESLEAARDRLLQLMENAETTEALLQAEQQLTYRESEIASLKGRLNYLATSAKLSRISIEISPYILSQPVDTGWNPSETVRRAWEDLVESFQDFVDFMIEFGIIVVPWLVFFGLIINGIVKFVRNRRAKKAEDES